MDLTTIPTTPIEPDEPRRRLAALAGTWRGRAQTWFEPGRPMIDEPWEGNFALILGGRFIRGEYASSVEGKPIAGELLIAYETSERFWRMAWVDSFHTAKGIIVSDGPVDGKAIVATASYFAGEGQPRWHWRTEVAEPVGETLTIVMFNILPDGTEAKAVEIVAKRE